MVSCLETKSEEIKKILQTADLSVAAGPSDLVLNGSALESWRTVLETQKEQLDKLDQKWEKRLEDTRFGCEDVLNLQMIGSLFGKGLEVVDCILDCMSMLKILVPNKSGAIDTVVDEIGNVRQMSSRFSLKSFKIWLAQVLKPEYCKSLELVIAKVRSESKISLPKLVFQIELINGSPSEGIFFENLGGDDQPAQNQQNQPNMVGPLATSSRANLAAQGLVGQQNASKPIENVKMTNPALHDMIQQIYGSKN